MRYLLSNLQKFLDAEIRENLNLVRLVTLKPMKQALSEFNQNMMPAIILWEHSEDLVEGLTGDEATRKMIVSLTIIGQSTDQGFIKTDSERSILAIRKKIEQLLKGNKKVKTADDPDGAATGIELPIRYQAFEWSKSSFYTVGSVGLIEFHRHDVTWDGLENSVPQHRLTERISIGMS